MGILHSKEQKLAKEILGKNPSEKNMRKKSDEDLELIIWLYNDTLTNGGKLKKTIIGRIANHIGISSNDSGGDHAIMLRLKDFADMAEWELEKRGAQTRNTNRNLVSMKNNRSQIYLPPDIMEKIYEDSTLPPVRRPATNFSTNMSKKERETYLQSLI
jgi:hypothetical protein